MLQTFFADLHVHIGRIDDQPVKIAASPKLTLDGIVEECVERKGIHIVGIVDSWCDPVYEELVRRAWAGVLEEHPQGGLIADDGRLTIMCGAELEVATGGKAAHYLAYFRGLHELSEFRKLIRPHITNTRLSSQVVRITPGQLLQMTRSCNGLFMLAHAFTPHKGYFGNCARRMTKWFTQDEVAEIAGIELGLSADTAMADGLSELHSLPFVSNSDAHSLGTIAREYTAFCLESPSFDCIEQALHGTGRQYIVANYGLDPRLGKYYRTFCPQCEKRVVLDADRRCADCQSRVVVGVYDRLGEIADVPTLQPPERPPYIHQVPLRFIPGIGPVTLGRLLEHFGTHMNVLHQASFDQLAAIVGSRLAEQIVAARSGKLTIQQGAGGRYGRINM